MNKDPEIPKLVNHISDLIYYLEKNRGKENLNISRSYDVRYVDLLHELRVSLVIQFNGDRNNE